MKNMKLNVSDAMLIAGALVLGTFSTCSTAADGGVGRDRGLNLARAAAHEAGLSASEEEVAALHAVMVERCGGSPRCQMRRFFNGRTPRRYLLELNRRGTRPQGWPAARFDRDAWLALLDTADRVVAGELQHQCDQPPQFWGMRSGVDLERALRAGWVRVDCGENVRNFFWAYPADRD